MTHVVCCILIVIATTGLRAQYWESLGGPGGGIVGSSIAPNGDIYVFTDLTTHRSTDQGVSWARMYSTHPMNSSITWAPSGTMYMVQKTILFKSIDGGGTWTQLKSFPVSHLTAFIVTTSKGDLVAANWDSIHVTTDEGAIWQAIAKPSQYEVDGLFVDRDDVIYLSVKNGYIYRSTDQGFKWTRIINDLPSNSSFSMASPAPGVVFCVRGNQLFRSFDKGRTWDKFYTHPDPVYRLIATPDVLFFLDPGYTLHKSTDGGISWQKILRNPNSYLYPLFVTDEDLFALGSGIVNIGELYKRNIQNGEQWEVVTTPTARVTHLASLSSKEVFAASIHASYYGFLWKFDGLRWYGDTAFRGVPISELSVDSLDNVFTVINNVLHKSTDAGNTWTNSLRLIDRPVGFAASRTDHYVLSNEGLFRSLDRGDSWDIVKTSVKFSTPSSFGIAGDYLYIGGVQNYYRSADNATSFDTPIFPFINGSDSVKAIAAVGSAVVFGVHNTGMYFSSDHGFTWENHSEGLVLDTINDLLITPSKAVFAATTSGVYEYSPFTKVWTNVNEGILSGKALSLALGDDGKVYVGTDGAGVYRTTKTWHTADVNEHYANSTTISAYPNPASSNVVIHLPSAVSYESRIVVYNILGEALPLTIDRSGSQVSIRVASLPNGRYVARVFDRTQVSSIPFIVQR